MLPLDDPNEIRYCTIHQYNTQESSNSSNSNNSAQLTQIKSSFTSNPTPTPVENSSHKVQ